MYEKSTEPAFLIQTNFPWYVLLATPAVEDVLNRYKKRKKSAIFAILLAIIV